MTYQRISLILIKICLYIVGLILIGFGFMAMFVNFLFGFMIAASSLFIMPITASVILVQFNKAGKYKFLCLALGFIILLVGGLYGTHYSIRTTPIEKYIEAANLLIEMEGTGPSQQMQDMMNSAGSVEDK